MLARPAHASDRLRIISPELPLFLVFGELLGGRRKPATTQVVSGPVLGEIGPAKWTRIIRHQGRMAGEE
jgi:hypothetical protein